MIYEEHFLKANTTIVVRHNNEGEASTFYEKDGYITMYPSLTDLIKDKVMRVDSEFVYIDDTIMQLIFIGDIYGYYKIKQIFNL